LVNALTGSPVLLPSALDATSVSSVFTASQVNDQSAFQASDAVRRSAVAGLFEDLFRRDRVLATWTAVRLYEE
jgi:hypothetical protein